MIKAVTTVTCLIFILYTQRLMQTIALCTCALQDYFSPSAYCPCKCSSTCSKRYYTRVFKITITFIYIDCICSRLSCSLPLSGLNLRTNSRSVHIQITWTEYWPEYTVGRHPMLGWHQHAHVALAKITAQNSRTWLF